jgi:hypothetical protein
MPTEHETHPHAAPASKPIEPVREADPKDRDPNLLPPDKAGDQLPGEPPGVHAKGEAGPFEEVEKKSEAKKPEEKK